MESKSERLDMVKSIVISWKIWKVVKEPNLKCVVMDGVKVETL